MHSSGGYQPHLCATQTRGSCPQHIRAPAVSAQDIEACSTLRAFNGIISGKLLVSGVDSALQVGTEDNYSAVSVHGKLTASSVQASTGQVAVLQVGTQDIRGELVVGSAARPGQVKVHGKLEASEVKADVLSSWAAPLMDLWQPVSLPSTMSVSFLALSPQAFSVLLGEKSAGYKTVQLQYPAVFEPNSNTGYSVVPTATYDVTTSGWAQAGTLLPLLVGIHNGKLEISFGWTDNPTPADTERRALVHVHLALFKSR